MTEKLDLHLFRTLNEKKSTPKQRSYYNSERHTLYLALSLLQTCPSLITKVGEQLADYFPCGGFVVTDQGEKGISSKWGFRCSNERFSSWDSVEYRIWYNTNILCKISISISLIWASSEQFVYNNFSEQITIIVRTLHMCTQRSASKISGRFLHTLTFVWMPGFRWGWGATPACSVWGRCSESCRRRGDSGQKYSPWHPQWWSQLHKKRIAFRVFFKQLIFGVRIYIYPEKKFVDFT